MDEEDFDLDVYGDDYSRDIFDPDEIILEDEDSFLGYKEDEFDD